VLSDEKNKVDIISDVFLQIRMAFPHVKIVGRVRKIKQPCFVDIYSEPPSLFHQNALRRLGFQERARKDCSGGNSPLRDIIRGVEGGWRMDSQRCNRKLTIVFNGPKCVEVRLVVCKQKVNRMSVACFDERSNPSNPA
jgi:hypothetical protein